MQSIAFVVPLLPGKAEMDRQAMESCWRGERKAAHRAARERQGVTRETVWAQKTPAGDVAVVLLEAHDLKRAFQGIASSDDPFDEWFRAHSLEVHGIDLTQPLPLPELVLDFRSDSAENG
ncbi:MAG TPA: hypothetical protein VHL54_13145 [Actinomycetota bacterium]|nr:hypothetical protein [Actinomycetota bacterium]